MYTTRKQTEHLIDSGIDPESADMMVVAGRGKDPFSNWNPIAKSVENCKKHLGKDCMPVWSDEALLNILPREVVDRNDEDPDTPEIRYDFIITKRVVPGRGKYYFLSYSAAPEPPFVAFLAPDLTTGLVRMVVEVMCKREDKLANYIW